MSLDIILQTYQGCMHEQPFAYMHIRMCVFDENEFMRCSNKRPGFREKLWKFELKMSMQQTEHWRMQWNFLLGVDQLPKFGEVSSINCKEIERESHLYLCDNGAQLNHFQKY